MMGLLKRVLRHSLTRYLVVGGLSYAVNVLLLNLLVEVVHLPRAWVAAPAAFLLTFVVSYTLQRVFAFRSEADVTGSVVRYTILVAINLVAQSLIHAGCERAGLGLATSQFIATGVTTVWNYFAYKHWVYVDRTHPLPPDEETVAWHERARAAANLGASRAGASSEPKGGQR